MSRTTPFATIAAKVNEDAASRVRIEEQKRAMDDALALQTLRDRHDRANGGSDPILNLTDANESVAKRGDPLYLRTLQRYVAEMGGTLVVEAVFPDMRVNLLRASDASVLPPDETTPVVRSPAARSS